MPVDTALTRKEDMEFQIFGIDIAKNKFDCYTLRRLPFQTASKQPERNNMDYLSEMALFVEVAQANGFSRAAAKLGISQSTLSQRIAALEDALGLRLFNRSTRRLELTGAGAYYFRGCW